MGAVKDLLIKLEERRAEAEAALMRRIAAATDKLGAGDDLQYAALPARPAPVIEWDDTDLPF